MKQLNPQQKMVKLQFSRAISDQERWHRLMGSTGAISKLPATLTTGAKLNFNQPRKIMAHRAQIKVLQHQIFIKTVGNWVCNRTIQFKNIQTTLKMNLNS